MLRDIGSAAVTVKKNRGYINVSVSGFSKLIKHL